MRPWAAANGTDLVVVVGAGSGGCHVAHALAAAGRPVLLLEAGARPYELKDDGWWRGKFRAPYSSLWWHWRVHVRAKPFQFFILGGKTLGGTSSVNGMVYTQGHVQDFPVPTGDVERAMASFGAPRLARRPKLNNLPPALRDLISAFGAAAVPWIGMHGAGPIRQGIGFMAGWATRTSSYREVFGAGRNHTALGMIQPGLITMFPSTRVRKLVWSDDERLPGVQGVEIMNSDNSTEIIFASRVVLAAGAIGTPSILLASGAPRRCGVPVGGGLQEHLGIEGSLILQAPCRLTDKPGDDGAWTASLVSTGLAHLTAFMGAYRPDIQVGLAPSCCTRMGGILCIRVTIILLRGLSRGRVHAAEVVANETMKPAHVSLELQRADVEALADAFEFIRRSVLTAPELDKWAPAMLLDGGRQPPENRKQLVDMLEPILYNYNHVTGTTSSALDSRLRLRGCRGVRVADASAFPAQITGHPDIPTRVLGRVVASYLLEDDAYESDSLQSSTGVDKLGGTSKLSRDDTIRIATNAIQGSTATPYLSRGMRNIGESGAVAK